MRKDSPLQDATFAAAGVIFQKLCKPLKQTASNGETHRAVTWSPSFGSLAPPERWRCCDFFALGLLPTETWPLGCRLEEEAGTPSRSSLNLYLDLIDPHTQALGVLQTLIKGPYLWFLVLRSLPWTKNFPKAYSRTSSLQSLTIYLSYR